MLPITPYQLKVRDFLRSESVVWEFYSMNSGDEWEITDRIIEAIFEQNDKHSAYWQMARIYRLYSAHCGDRVAGKVAVPADDPEYPVRRRTLQLWQQHGEAAEPFIARLIEGQQELDTLDVFNQDRIRGLTRELIGAFLRPAWMRMADVVVLAMEYFPDLDWPEEEGTAGEPDISESADIRDSQVLGNVLAEHGSIKDYFAFVLVDFVVADPGLQDRSAARAKIFAAQLGIADSFVYIYENYGKQNRRPL